MFRVCHIFLSVYCWERANPLAILFMMFSCAFVTFPCGVLGQAWYLIVSIHDLCLLTYFPLGAMDLYVICVCTCLIFSGHTHLLLVFFYWQDIMRPSILLTF